MNSVLSSFICFNFFKNRKQKNMYEFEHCVWKQKQVQSIEDQMKLNESLCHFDEWKWTMNHSKYI